MIVRLIITIRKPGMFNREDDDQRSNTEDKCHDSQNENNDIFETLEEEE